jgi:Cytochrome C oxidase, cbb3-type, subunit III
MDSRTSEQKNLKLKKLLYPIAVVAALLLITVPVRTSNASCSCGKTWPHLFCRSHYCVGPGDISNVDMGEMWYWMRSPEQERRVVMNLFNRYCIRCHGVDGRGVWDIPDVPDFTHPVWQATRPDSYRTRVILEGRGAVMPAFRGTLTLEEACALGRYLYTFAPETQISRPDLSEGGASAKPTANPPVNAPANPPTARPASTPPTSAPSPFSR